MTVSGTLRPWYEDALALVGLPARCARVRAVSTPFRSVTEVQHELEAEIVALANRAVAEDGADATILVGAPLTGLAARVGHAVPVPLIDSLTAASAPPREEKALR